MLTVRRARVPVCLLPAQLAASVPDDALDPCLECDLTIDGDRIETVGPSAAGADGGYDAGGRLVFPGLVDPHVHLDKTGTWDRAPNRTGTFAEALERLAADKANWTEEDLRLRAGRALAAAHAFGTRLMRTHVDTFPPHGEASHAVMAALRREWAGRVELQTVPLCGGASYRTPAGGWIADTAVRHGASALGGFFVMTPELPAELDALLGTAQERGLGIDLHVDESGDPAAEVLRAVAEAVLRRQFDRPVVCGHACSLSRQAPERVRSTLALAREARIRVISLPQCNLYLQDRRRGSFPRSPVWRGLAPLHDLLDAGIPVACASDNVGDAFHPYGAYNAADVWAQAVQLAHLDERLREASAVVASTAADALGCPAHGRIAPGAVASLVIFAVRSLRELISRPAASRERIDGETVPP